MTYSATWKVESSFSSQLPGQCDVRISAKNSAMPDIHANPNQVKKPDRKFADQSSPIVDKSIGFDPYDTGVLQYKKLQD